jgi:TrmH family RNA methyltransferase
MEKWVTHKVTIPSFGGAESLNVAIATAIFCDNFKRLLSK